MNILIKAKRIIEIEMILECTSDFSDEIIKLSVIKYSGENNYRIYTYNIDIADTQFGASIIEECINKGWL